MNTLRTNLDRLANWFQKHRTHFAKELCAGASVETLADLDKTLALRLPDELKTLLAWRNGQNPESLACFESNWHLMGADQIAQDKQTLLDPDAEQTGWRTEWIPFLSDGYGNYICMDSNKSPAPLRGFWLGNAEHAIVAESLSQWVADFADAVEAGKYVEEHERGTFVKR